MKNILLYILISMLGSTLYGQMEKSVTQDFNIDKMLIVDFEMPREYLIQKWAGTQILVETRIKLEYGNAAILKFTLDSERYVLELVKNGEDKVTIRAKDMNPKTLKTKIGEVIETTIVTIYVPEEFNIEDPLSIHRDVDSNSTTIRTGN